MTKPCVKEVHTTMYVDSNHAGDLLTRRFQSGVLIYVNPLPIIWYPKIQNMVGSSTFGYEFLALRFGSQLFKGLRYKLRMMSIPLDGLSENV